MEYAGRHVAARVIDPAAIRIVQITDTHLFADAAESYDGVDTAATLAAVIEDIVRTVGVPDLVLLTGDLVEDPVPAAYARLADLLQGLPGAVYCLPGNHDDPALMRANFAGAKISMPGIIDAGSWRIVMLDTFQPGKHAGRLAPSELNFLEQALADARERPVLVCLHHPPVPIGSPWMDAMGLENGAEFIDCIERHSNVRAVLWGHIHQEFVLQRGHVYWYGTPSTCVQFPPGATEYRLTDEAPGFREFVLHADGTFKTRVVRLS